MTDVDGDTTATELAWEVNGLQLAGLSWGDAGERPVLALHGWLDNAASFTALAPHLRGCHVVAPDLTGHGRSDWRSADATYQIWDDLPELVGIVDQLGRQQFDIMGHSRGAVIAALLASVLASMTPNRVRQLVLLDGIAPQAVSPTDFPGQMATALADKQRLSKRQHRTFERFADAVAVRTEGLSERAATVICERNVKRVDGKLTWSTDPRLQGASPVKLSEPQIEAVWQALTMPVLLLLASEGQHHAAPEYMQRVRQAIPTLNLATIEGGHHFHLEDAAVEVAHQITQFLLATHDSEQPC